MFEFKGTNGLRGQSMVGFYPKALAKIRGWIQACDIEVSGILEVEVLSPTRIVVVDALICKQKCTGAYTVLDDEAKGLMFLDHERPEKLIGHWHSHVKGPTQKSGTDDANYKDQIDFLGKGCQLYIAVIANKKDELTTYIYYPQLGKYTEEDGWENVPYFEAPPSTVLWNSLIPEFKPDVDIKELVTEDKRRTTSKGIYSYSGGVNASSGTNHWASGSNSLKAEQVKFHRGLALLDEPIRQYELRGAYHEMAKAYAHSPTTWERRALEMAQTKPGKGYEGQFSDYFEALLSLFMTVDAEQVTAVRKAFDGKDPIEDLILNMPALAFLDYTVDEKGEPTIIRSTEPMSEVEVRASEERTIAPRQTKLIDVVEVD